MKQKEIEKLRKGDFIEHKQLGLCIIDKIALDGFGRYFGLEIRPLSVKGFNTLSSWSGVFFNRMMETTNRLVLAKIENPVIPKLIFQTEKGFEVHQWKELGEVSKEGKFSSVKLKVFPTIEEARNFCDIKT